MRITDSLSPLACLFLASMAAAAKPEQKPFVLAEEPVADEAAFAARYGPLEGCDLVDLARRAEASLSLPVQRLRTGAQRVAFRYVEAGWPLGFSPQDCERPAALGSAPEEWFRNLPAAGRGKRGYGVLRLEPGGEPGNRFAVVLEGGPEAWPQARLWVAARGDGDFSRAAALKDTASPGSPVFGAIAVVHPSYHGAGSHPLLLSVFTDLKGERLRYYAIAHWRAEVEFPTGEKAYLILYDFRGTGDYSLNALAVADASYSASELYTHTDGGDIFYRRAPAADIEWKSRGFLEVGRALRLPRALVRLKGISPRGDWADVELEPR